MYELGGVSEEGVIDNSVWGSGAAVLRLGGGAVCERGISEVGCLCQPGDFGLTERKSCQVRQSSAKWDGTVR